MYLKPAYIVFVFFFMQVLGEPSIVSISEDKTEKVGSTVSLVCKLADIANSSVEWVKLANHNAIESQQIPDDDRISKILDTSANIYTLEINKIKSSDEGWYRCQIQLPTSKVTAETRLRVLQPAYILNNTAASVIVNTGEDAKLECYADGIPEPEVWWRRDNYEIFDDGQSTHKGNVLQITKAARKDRGLYDCLADNEVGEDIKRIMLQVKFAPEIETRYSGHGQVQGKKGNLTCTVYGYPTVTVSWLKGRQQMTPGDNLSISTVSTEDHMVSTTLTINALAEADYGTYTCKAKNELGASDRSLLLYDTTSKSGEEEFISGSNSLIPSATVVLSMFLVAIRFLTSS